MTKTKRWLYVFLSSGAWAFVSWLYARRLEMRVEPRLFAQGEQNYWWIIVLLYWMVDTAIVICFARAMAKPFGMRMPAQFPFFQFASDVAAVVLLVHIAYTCADTNLFPKLMSIGLGIAPQAFIVLAFGWIAVAIAKYKQLVKIVDREFDSHEGARDENSRPSYQE